MALPGTLDKAWNMFDLTNKWSKRVLKLETEENENHKVWHAWVWSDKWQKGVRVAYCYWDKNKEYRLAWSGFKGRARVDAPKEIQKKFLLWLQEQMEKRGQSLDITRTLKKLENKKVKI